MKKQGFTLAEVLITLVIIGIIASLTLPSLLGGTNKQEIKTGLQKAISVLSQAITLEYALTGDDFSTLGAENATTVANFAQTRLNLKTYDGNVFTTQDGVIYNMTAVNGSCSSSTPCGIVVDVNGSKAPNAITVDTATTLSEIKDQFKIYVYGTTVTASAFTCTNETENGQTIKKCSFNSNSAASRFLNDEIIQ